MKCKVQKLQLEVEKCMLIEPLSRFLILIGSTFCLYTEQKWKGDSLIFVLSSRLKQKKKKRKWRMEVSLLSSRFSYTFLGEVAFFYMQVLT